MGVKNLNKKEIKMTSIVFQVTKSFPIDIYEDRICVAFYNEWARSTGESH